MFRNLLISLVVHCREKIKLYLPTNGVISIMIYQYELRNSVWLQAHGRDARPTCARPNLDMRCVFQC